MQNYQKISSFRPAVDNPTITPAIPDVATTLVIVFNAMPVDAID